MFKRALIIALLNHSFLLWRRGVVVLAAAQLHSSKSELRFCAGSNPTRGVPELSEIRDGEDLLQLSRLEIRLNAFRQSTIPQEKIHHKSMFKMLYYLITSVIKLSHFLHVNQYCLFIIYLLSHCLY